MKKVTTGYEDQDDFADNPRSPHTRKWELKLHAQGPGFVRLEVLLDDAPIGMLRVPDLDHVRWLREKIQNV